MNAMFVYLVKSALSMAVLYAIYWFFLRRDTFFRVNRFYLLSIILFSLVLPLLPLEWKPAARIPAVGILLDPVLITPGKIRQSMPADLQWFSVMATIYLTGVAIFLLRFILQLVQLGMIARRFGISEYHDRRVVFVDRGYAPFSFFNLVFISDPAIHGGSLETILDHEQVHMRQRHTFDLILVELAIIVQWFNPVAWLAGREIKSIHEYLADEGVLQNGLSPTIYQQMILNETMGIRVNNLTNNFNVSLIKKRIAMMTKSKSTAWAKGKVLIALPVLLALGLMLTAGTQTTVKIAGAPVLTMTGPLTDPGPVLQDKAKKETQVKYVAPVVPDSQVYVVVEKQPSYPGGQDGYRKFLIENIKYPEEALKKGVTGTVFITFVVEKDGSVTHVKVLRGIGSGCDEEALRVVKMMPKWVPGELKGKKVAVQFNLPIRFNLDGKKEEPKK